MIFLRRADKQGLLHASDTPAGKRFAMRYSFLYQDYCTTYYFWESVIMLRCWGGGAYPFYGLVVTHQG